MQFHDNRQEQRLLLYSIAVTVIDAALGIAVGLSINSSSIVFDGVYSVVDAAMTALALGVSVLLAKGSTRHFQFGFWHLEPMLVLLNSIVLSLSCGYAFLVALNDLFGGGRTVSFGPGAIYAVGAGIVALVAGIIIGRQARRLGSDLLGIDARNWIVSGVVSVALGISFLLAGVVHGTRFDHLAPYLDPAVLAVLSLALLPLPLRACWRSARDIIQIAPGDLDEEVRRLAQDIQQRHGFEDFTTYVAKMGRARFVDITFLAGADFGPRPLNFFDGIRAEIAEGLGSGPPSHWLNIEFTHDRQWL
ncbi:cation diffusion facilitator family transporter [Enterovirga rhinocerotis]|uniref:Putative Co/Zn/Cd cation transporter (Cation efflux family) n=1 Tax=Enterovirga rhinocerotis TaxID=1339210 RepID=A0A4R7BX87_9HYPH|nr:cation transporter [Enterovirga rhinocerotis]TDR90123.1 putative Co/Zn/Cd cation transporter (cation efflux family) [Enterovirga rhinocerotis]